MFYQSIEIGSLCGYPVSTIKALDLDPHVDHAKSVLDRACKIAISCSRTIFLAHDNPSWNVTHLL